MLALLPSDGPLYRGRLLRALAAFAVPAGIATALGSILSFFLVDTVFGGSLDAGRTAATTTLIVLGLAFVLLLERGPGREHIAIQGSMLVMILSLCALFALILGAAPVREFFEMTAARPDPVVPHPLLRRRRADDRQRALAPAPDRTPRTTAGTGRDRRGAHAVDSQTERLA